MICIIDIECSIDVPKEIRILSVRKVLKSASLVPRRVSTDEIKLKKLNIIWEVKLLYVGGFGNVYLSVSIVPEGSKFGIECRNRIGSMNF